MGGMYLKALQKLGRGQLNWEDGGSVYKLLLSRSADYTPDLTVDEFLDDIPGPAQVASTSALTGRSVLATGAWDCADASADAVAEGDACDVVVLYKDTGSAATSPLIYLWNDPDDDFLSGMPVTPDGTDIVLQVSNGANRLLIPGGVCP